MNKYRVDTGSKPIKIFDKKKQELTLQNVIVERNADTWLQLHSRAKAIKAPGMNSRSSKRFEERLSLINESLDKKSNRNLFIGLGYHIIYN